MSTTAALPRPTRRKPPPPPPAAQSWVADAVAAECVGSDESPEGEARRTRIERAVKRSTPFWPGTQQPTRGGLLADAGSRIASNRLRPVDAVARLVVEFGGVAELVAFIAERGDLDEADRAALERGLQRAVRDTHEGEPWDFQ